MKLLVLLTSLFLATLALSNEQQRYKIYLEDIKNEHFSREWTFIGNQLFKDGNLDGHPVVSCNKNSKSLSSKKFLTKNSIEIICKYLNDNESTCNLKVYNVKEDLELKKIIEKETACIEYSPIQLVDEYNFVIQHNQKAVSINLENKYNLTYSSSN